MQSHIFNGTCIVQLGPRVHTLKLLSTRLGQHLLNVPPITESAVNAIPAKHWVGGTNYIE